MLPPENLKKLNRKGLVESYEMSIRVKGYKKLKISIMDKTTKVVIVIAVLATVVFWSGLFSKPKLEPKLGGGGEPKNYLTNFGALATTTSKTVTGVASLILPANSGASARCFAITAGTSSIALGFGTSTGLTISTGYTLFASTTKIFSGSEMFTGDIWAIGPSGAGDTVSVCQF